ncbi:MAG: hypothetical protein LIP09_14190 [Bacteroidales bacterium]|nr:hypothetical protein [Bacteroidales bacterium]MCC8119878.1 hypothetical protein [Bacteroidales bacterium]
MEQIKITKCLFTASVVALALGFGLCLLALCRGCAEAAGFGFVLMASSLAFAALDCFFNKYDDEK